MIQEKNLNLEDVLQNMGDAFVSLDLQWRYRFVNDNALKLMGKKREELIGKAIWEIFPDIKGTIFDIEYHKVMRQQVHSSFETYYAAYDMWMEVRAHPYKAGICIFYTDITARKKAEQNLQEISERYQLFARLNPVGIFHTDEKGNCLFVSDKWRELTGITQENTWVAGL